MTELGVLVRARVHAATGRWLDERDAEDIARSTVRAGVDFELAVAEINRTLALAPSERERIVAELQALADGTTTA